MADPANLSLKGISTWAQTNGNGIIASKVGAANVGATNKPVWISAGTVTACSSTVGSSSLPVYMNAGTVTACSTTLGVSITGTAYKIRTSAPSSPSAGDIWIS